MSSRWWREVAVVLVAAAADLYVYGGDRAARGGGAAPAWLVPALTVVVFAALLLRWRYPVAVFLVQWTYGLVGLVLPDYAPFAGLLVALHAVGCQVRTQLSITALALCAVPLTVNNINAAGGHAGDFLGVASALTAAWLVIAAAVWAVGRRTYVSDRRAAILQQLQADQAAEAVRAERVRLARDLHDIVTNAVSAMVMQAAGARALFTFPDERVAQTLASIETSGVQAMEELHRLLGLLRKVDPDVNDVDSANQPGLMDIPALVALSRTAGLDVETVTDGSPAHLDRSVELAAYRVVQEALTNAMKHGGTGGLLRLHQTWGEDWLTIRARNIPGLVGSRLAVPSSGFGLQGLAERVNLVGGRFEAGPAGDGFLVSAELPLARAHADRAAPR